MNMYKKDKLILVDCDGVLVDWAYSFDCWMEARGYELTDEHHYDVAKRYGIPRHVTKSLVRDFNESAAIGFLPPLRDAVYYIKKLHKEHGFVFHCITSLSLDKYAGKLRKRNLEMLFGETVFDEVICLDCGADKEDALRKYADTECYWVEDKVENAEEGLLHGLDSILVAHDHNANYEGEIPRYWKWKHIYEHITS